MVVKFSHDYPKLQGQRRAKLFLVVRRKRADMPPALIEYDTVYDGGHYPLPPGNYMILYFVGEHLIPFTTIRPYNPKKYEFYTGAIGFTFDVEVAGK